MEFSNDFETEEETVVTGNLTVGSFFGDRYRLDGVLGSGAMGKVFRASDLQDGTEVALKVLHADKARKPQVVERFRREAQILMNLGHVGIVGIHSYGRTPDDRTEYIAMELLEGVSLKDRVRRDGPFSPERFLPILITICDALGAAHAQGVIHRDLKPDNVVISEDEPPIVKVLDFGLSRMMTNKRITKTGVMIGTPRYMAPEQIRSAKDVDERTDIYACGVLAHESIIGDSPFPAEDAGQLLGCVIENRVLKIEDLRPDLPASIGPVVRRAMAKEPKDRFATIGAFAEAFAGAIGQATGRSGLVDQGGMGNLFDEAVQGSGAPLNVGPITAPPDHARFTRPPEQPRKPKPHKKKRKRPSPLTAFLFVLALIVVACVSTGGALALRMMLEGHTVDGLTDRIGNALGVAARPDS